MNDIDKYHHPLKKKINTNGIKVAIIINMQKNTAIALSAYPVTLSIFVVISLIISSFVWLMVQS
jgi:hypothetical protein